MKKKKNRKSDVIAKKRYFSCAEILAQRKRIYPTLGGAKTENLSSVSQSKTLPAADQPLLTEKVVCDRPE